MGLTIKDLNGKMEQVEILDFSQSEKEGKSIVVLKVQSKDKTFDIGLFGCADEVLYQRGSEKDGKKILEIPASKISTDEKIVWINQPY
jgi:hypothetical protein